MGFGYFHINKSDLDHLLTKGLTLPPGYEVQDIGSRPDRRVIVGVEGDDMPDEPAVELKAYNTPNGFYVERYKKEK